MEVLTIGKLKELLKNLDNNIEVGTNNINGFPDIASEILLMECDGHKVMVLNGTNNNEHPFCRDYTISQKVLN